MFLTSFSLHYINNTLIFYRTEINEGSVRIGIILFSDRSRVAIGLNNNFTYEELIGNFVFEIKQLYAACSSYRLD